MSKAEELTVWCRQNAVITRMASDDKGQNNYDLCAAYMTSHQRLKEALDWCVAEINRDSPSVINGRAALEQAKDLE